MITHWLHQKQRNHLIIFFSGYGLSFHPFERLDSTAYDVLMVYGYHHPCFPDFILSQAISYKEVTIVGWSMGVYMGALWCQKNEFRPNFALAIAGTLQPLDDEFGIPPKIFRRTAQRWESIENQKAFIHNIIIEEYESSFLLENSFRSVKEQQEELLTLIEITSENVENPYNCVIIAEWDNIFSKEKVSNFWNKNCVKLLMVDKAHFAFFQWLNWDSIISYGRIE